MTNINNTVRVVNTTLLPRFAQGNQDYTIRHASQTLNQLSNPLATTPPLINLMILIRQLLGQFKTVLPPTIPTPPTLQMPTIQPVYGVIQPPVAQPVYGVVQPPSIQPVYGVIQPPIAQPVYGGIQPPIAQPVYGGIQVT